MISVPFSKYGIDQSQIRCLVRKKLDEIQLFFNRKLDTLESIIKFVTTIMRYLFDIIVINISIYVSCLWSCVHFVALATFLYLMELGQWIGDIITSYFYYYCIQRTPFLFHATPVASSYLYFLSIIHPYDGRNKLFYSRHDGFQFKVIFTFFHFTNSLSLFNIFFPSIYFLSFSTVDSVDIVNSKS